MIVLPKINFKTPDTYIILGIVIINLFWLPTSSFWSLYPKKEKIVDSKLNPILSYEHPQIPTIRTDNKTPYLSAQNFILIDTDTNTILLSKNKDSRIYPASITKLATAITALNIYPLDEIITVNQPYKEGQVMELQVGEKISVRSLITALLVYSANDSAFNLASHSIQNINGFVDQMNNLAKKYNLSNTHFTNFDGLHNPDHYSSAYSLSQLGRLAMRNPIIRQTVRLKNITVTDTSGNISHNLVSTDELLNVVPEIEGFKTGWTPEAGQCFLGLININGHYLISVVAQSQDRFVDTKLLVDWAKTNITWGKYE